MVVQQGIILSVFLLIFCCENLQGASAAAVQTQCLAEQFFDPSIGQCHDCPTLRAGATEEEENHYALECAKHSDVCCKSRVNEGPAGKGGGVSRKDDRVKSSGEGGGSSKNNRESDGSTSISKYPVSSSSSGIGRGSFNESRIDKGGGGKGGGGGLGGGVSNDSVKNGGGNDGKTNQNTVPSSGITLDFGSIFGISISVALVALLIVVTVVVKRQKPSRRRENKAGTPVNNRREDPSRSTPPTIDMDTEGNDSCVTDPIITENPTMTNRPFCGTNLSKYNCDRPQ